jgi:hypothetical protein
LRVTIVTTSTPSPRKPRTLGFVKVLLSGGHTVCVVCITDRSLGGRATDAKAALTTLRCLGADIATIEFRPTLKGLASSAAPALRRTITTETILYSDPGLTKRVSEVVLASAPDVLHVDRIRALGSVSPLGIPTIVDITDPRTVFRSQYKLDGSMRPLPLAAREALRAALDFRPSVREEREITGLYVTLVASELGEASLPPSTERFPQLVVPNALFPDERRTPAAKTPGPAAVALTGNLRYPPNVFAVNRWANEIWPALARRQPDSVGVVIGAAPRERTRQTIQAAGLELRCDVASVPAALSDMRVVVAPQQVVGGFPNRVADSVYRAGLPVVASSESLAGLPPWAAEFVVRAGCREEWVEECTRLSRDPMAARKLVDVGQGLLQDFCSPHVIESSLLRAYRRAMAG